MDYFKILNLRKEPFSNSPDPEFFFHSRQHEACLQKLELSLLLRRGLNVVIGDVGTGKTTLCRQLIRRFSQKDEIETHLILDPQVGNAAEFLAAVTRMFRGKNLRAECNDWQAKEMIKHYLFRQGVKQGKTVVLIIDEGQKMPSFCLEILREFLNYETNQHKLLQIVIFAQKEFADTIRRSPNFADRINLYHTLEPLDFRDTRMMIKYRLEKSSSSRNNPKLFTFPALRSVYRISGGYPRKIINLCHQSILTMIIQNRSKCGYKLVKTCARRIFAEDTGRHRLLQAGLATLAALAAALVIFSPAVRFQQLQTQGVMALQTVISKAVNHAFDDPAAESAARIVDARIPATAQVDRSKPVMDPARPVAAASGAAAQASSAKSQPSMGEPADPDKAPAVSEAPVNDEPFSLPADPAEKTVESPLAAAFDTISGQAPMQKKSLKATHAAILGRITLERDETLSRIMMGIYGVFNSRYFKSLIMANPDIEDPDRIDVGRTISLPAIPARVRPLGFPVWWIKIDERDTLEAAFDLLRKHPKNISGVRLIPYWNPSAGTRFAVLLDKLFKDENAARRHLQQLPAELVSNCTILSKWEKETVYFSNPYFNGN